MGFKKIIKDKERGFLFENGFFKKMLLPGIHRLPWFKEVEVKVLNTNQIFNIQGYDIDFFLDYKDIVKELSVLSVKDYEIGLHYENDILKNVYKAGKYAFFNENKKHEFKLIDKREAQVDESFDSSILNSSLLYGHITTANIYKYEAGLLYFNNKFQRVLTEGIYYFWTGSVNSSVIRVDLRQQQIEITGQELMTLDKITLRLNFIAHYKVIKPEKTIHNISNYREQIYILLQLILREYIGSLTLDEILQNKHKIGEYVLAKIKEKESDFGIEFVFSGLKDVILPGEVKDILNTILIAEKKSQANMIMRREETASTRSLLNTAKLLDGNKTLHRLKEMEYVEKIFDKINSVSLSSNSNILEQVQTLLLKDLGEK